VGRQAGGLDKSMAPAVWPGVAQRVWGAGVARHGRAVLSASLLIAGLRVSLTFATLD
jgi:hypothetical protein